jgi:hypothetical protein
MAGLVPAIPIIGHCAIVIEIAGTSPAMTPRVLPLLRQGLDERALTRPIETFVRGDKGLPVGAAPPL